MLMNAIKKAEIIKEFETLSRCTMISTYEDGTKVYVTGVDINSNRQCLGTFDLIKKDWISILQTRNQGDLDNGKDAQIRAYR